MMHKIQVIADEKLPVELQQVIKGMNSDCICLTDVSKIDTLKQRNNLFFLITSRPGYWGILSEKNTDDGNPLLVGFRGAQWFKAQKPDIWVDKGYPIASKRLCGQILWETFNVEFNAYAKGSVSAFLDLIGAAMLVYTREGDLLYANNEIENLTGWSFKDLYYRPVMQYLRLESAEEGEERDFSLFFKKPGQIGHLNFLLSDGTWQTLIFHNYIIPISPIGEEVLVILTGNHLKTDFSGLMEPVNRLHERAILHDFRNLLQGVVTYTDLLGLELDPTTPSYGYIEKMRIELRRAQEILRHLMYPEPTSEPVIPSLDQYIEHLLQTFREIIPSHISLEFEGACPCRVAITPADLGRILRNLIKNSVDAFGAGEGKILLKTERANPPNYSGNKTFVRIVVSDNGPGIPDHLKDQVFKPFFTTHKENGGTGLGLYSVQSTVTKNEGIISFESEQGVGTSFVIFLPLASQ